MHYTFLFKYIKAGKFPTNDNITLWKRLNLYTIPVIQFLYNDQYCRIIINYKLNNILLSVKLKDIISRSGHIIHGDIEYLIGREDHKEFTLDINGNILYLSKLGLIPINNAHFGQFKILDCPLDTRFLIIYDYIHNKKYNSYIDDFNGSYFKYIDGTLIPCTHEDQII